MYRLSRDKLDDSQLTNKSKKQHIHIICKSHMQNGIDIGILFLRYGCFSLLAIHFRKPNAKNYHRNILAYCLIL